MKIQHHEGARGPALCVKAYTLESAVPKGCDGTDEQQRCARQSTSDRWWDAAADIAQGFGFKTVYSAGRSSGWLYTDPLPRDVEGVDNEGFHTQDPGEYPAAFVTAIDELLKRAPQMYAEELDRVISERRDHDEEQAKIDAMPMRLAFALATLTRGGRDAGEACVCLTNHSARCPHNEARAVLADFAEILEACDADEGLTDEGSELLEAIRGSL